MGTRNLFELPTSPEQFSVLLPVAELRQLDFSALEFATARKALVEYIKTYFPNDFNDFVSNNGIIMLTELISYVTSLLSLRADILANEGFLPTAKSENAVVNHLALIDQKLKTQTPATVDIECSIPIPLSSDIRISPGEVFDIRGDDGKQIFYEVYSAPDDTTSDIVIPAGKRGVIAFGIEGKTVTTVATSDGTEDQVISVKDKNILGEPVKVKVTYGAVTEEWTRVDTIERALSSDKVFEVRFFEGELQIVFGNNINGKMPAGGSVVRITYRTGGGVRGRIGVGVIDSQRPITPQYPYTAPVLVRFRNVLASSGGTDKESLDQAKKRAPREFAAHGAAITESDYAHLASGFIHPAFGAVSKAIATVRTGKNANLIEVYVLAEGPGGVPVQPNQGLKKALASYLDEINVLTDMVEVKGGSIKPIDIRATVVMNKNADASIVKEMVEAAITDFFDISNRDMGQPFYLARLYEKINKIDGVSYIDIFEPTDNILETHELAAEDTDSSGSGTPIGIGINEVITLGSKEIAYYYESTR